MVKSTTKAVQKSLEKHDKRRRVFNLSPERDDQLMRLKKDYGSMQAVFEAGLDALERQGEITKADVKAWLDKHVQD